MRRAAPPLPISPKLLKHFAALTLVLTGCIAMFADGESREAIQEQVDMRAARNQLLETEAEKLGTRKVRANLAIKDRNRAPSGFADDGGMIDVTVGEGAVSRQISAPRTYSPGGARQPGIQADRPPVPILPNTPGASITLRGVPADVLPGPQVKRGSERKRTGSIRPTAEQQAQIKELSRARTGSVSAE